MRLWYGTNRPPSPRSGSRCRPLVALATLLTVGVLAAWPVDHTSGAPKAGSGVTASLLGSIKRSDGSTQVTFNKHPLYYFARDTGPGQQNGQGIDAFGAEWYVLSPAGKAVGG
jgi:hypothetical protein